MSKHTRAAVPPGVLVHLLRAALDWDPDLGRSIGLMGHYFDQNRLEQGLYRHPLDVILHDVPDWPEVVG